MAVVIGVGDVRAIGKCVTALSAVFIIGPVEGKSVGGALFDQVAKCVVFADAEVAVDEVSCLNRIGASVVKEMIMDGPIGAFSLGKAVESVVCKK